MRNNVIIISRILNNKNSKYNAIKNEWNIIIAIYIIYIKKINKLIFERASSK